MVESWLKDIRDIRNALVHFLADADEIERGELDMAHRYFIGIVNTV